MVEKEKRKVKKHTNLPKESDTYTHIETHTRARGEGNPNDTWMKKEKVIKFEHRKRLHEWIEITKQVT